MILSLGGTDINDESGLRFKLATLKLGERASARIWRDGREQTVQVTAELPKESPARDERFMDGYHPLDGATVVNLSPALAEELGVPEPLICDVTSDESIQSTFRVIGERMPEIDFVVHAIAFARVKQL